MYMVTQQRNIKEKLITFKRIIHGIINKIRQTFSNIAKTKNSNVKTFKIPKNIYNKRISY